MNWPLLSVVTPCKDRPDEMRRLAEQVRQQDYPALEHIVVDDGSTPPLPRMRVALQVRHEESRGASAARNEAIRHARGELIVSLDDDVTLLGTDLLRRAVTIALDHPEAGIIGFRQRRPEGTLHYLQPAQCDELCRTSRFFGYAFLVRRSAIGAAGDLYERLGYGAEEIEWSLRILDSGYEIFYAPTLEVTHHESEIGRDWSRFRRLTLRNQFYTTVVRHPWWVIVPSLAIQSARFIRTTARQEGVDWAALRFAATQTMRSFRVLLRERKPIRFATLLRTRRLNRNPELIGGGVSESNRPFDASAPKQRF